MFWKIRGVVSALFIFRGLGGAGILQAHKKSHLRNTVEIVI